MLKQIINAWALLLLTATAAAQTIQPSMVTPQGGNFIAGGQQLSWTTGGLVTPTLTAGGYILTQSFEQPELQVWTGSIGPTGICPGAVLNVPFIQSGISSGSNVFTAQLSNAAGSFASPVTIGTVTGKLNGSISCTIPIATPAGSGYRIRVKSSLPLFTGTDNGNNISVWAKPTCNITVVPQNNTYTGGVPTNVYIGYGPQRVTLNVSASGGAPFTYNWTGDGTLNCYNCAAPVFAPAAAGSYDFTVRVTNASGCSSTCTVTVCVSDIRVPGTNGSKVYVCHNGNTQSLALNAVPAHVPGHNNDRLGKCNDQPCAAQRNSFGKGDVAMPGEVTDAAVFGASAMPNPSRDYFNIVTTSSSKALMTVRVTDVYGRILLVKTGVVPNTTLRLGENLFSGTYLVQVVQEDKEQTLKVIKVK